MPFRWSTDKSIQLGHASSGGLNSGSDHTKDKYCSLTSCFVWGTILRLQGPVSYTVTLWIIRDLLFCLTCVLHIYINIEITPSLSWYDLRSWMWTWPTQISCIIEYSVTDRNKTWEHDINTNSLHHRQWKFVKTSKKLLYRGIFFSVVILI